MLPSSLEHIDWPKFVLGNITQLCWSITSKYSPHIHTTSTLSVRFFISTICFGHTYWQAPGRKIRYKRTDCHVSLFLFYRSFANKIQSDSGGICTTLGNDSMSDSKQKSSYEHGSDFERLRSYDRLKLGKKGNDYWQWTEENNKPA